MWWVIGLGFAAGGAFLAQHDNVRTLTPADFSEALKSCRAFLAEK